MKPLYVFIDESGDFNFTKNGSKFYIINAVITQDPTEGTELLSLLKYRLLTYEIYPEITDEIYRETHLANGFHCTYDKQLIRDEVFKIISGLEGLKVNTLVIRKNRTNPSIRTPEVFYSKMSGFLINYIQSTYNYSKLCILFNGLPTERQKQALKKGIKTELAQREIDKEYSIFFPNSSTDRYLDIADYICWAIARKWERNDNRSYEIIKKFMGRSEWDIFVNGDMEYYQFDPST